MNEGSKAASNRQHLRIRYFLRERLKELEADSFNIWRPAAQERASRLLAHDFLHTLFLEEWLLGLSGESERLLAPLSDPWNMADRERLMAADLHLEILKKSPFFARWHSVLSVS
jgi:hypothetical protein